MSKKIVAILIGLIILTVFVIYSPEIDKYLASLTYNYVTKKFYGEIHLWCKIIYHSIPVITVLLIVIPLFKLIKWKSNTKLIKKQAAIILLSFVLGPGLIVNTLFKDHWGRPRPYQVLRDGKIFSPFYKPHFGNPSNNSFPCGHGSIGFFVGVPLIVAGRRKAGIILSLGFGSLVSLVRMLQGGHYLSDIIFCAIFVLLSVGLVNYTINRYTKSETHG